MDVLILGAGLSGIGCAAYLNRNSPNRSWRILEMRDDLGGTWDLFRYPGIRSDSDLYTFAYEFKPWDREDAIAGGDEIKRYIAETADEYDVRDHIRFGRKVISCDWSSDLGLWQVTTEQAGDGKREVWRARWIFNATGYYDYEQGFRPDFEGEETFSGQIIHPQHWPEDLDYSGKRIAVIGSGATAVTLLPSLAEKAAHVVQVQRTPTYVVPLPKADPLLKSLGRWLPENWVHRFLRRKNIWRQHVFFMLCQKYPETMRKYIRKGNLKSLGENYPVDTHFNPPYGPWDQRLCVVPEGDMFKSLKRGDCSIVTGHIDRFTETGLRMKDGSEVQADIIVTATGLNLKLAGGAAYSIDGQPVNFSDRIIFKGLMLDGVPNLAMAIGYTNSSWTLKIGLLCEYLTRLLNEMETQGKTICIPQRPTRDMALRPLLDFGAGYVQRSIENLPKQGDRYPWEMTFSYREDEKMMKKGRVIEPEMQLSVAPETLVEAAE